MRAARRVRDCRIGREEAPHIVGCIEICGTNKAADALAPGATEEDVRAAAVGRGDTVVVVGHQPDCGRIAAALGDGAEPAFPPAGAVVLDLQE